MFDELFIFMLSAGIVLLFAWAFRTLPGENWQILACIPLRKRADGILQGANLTYYGLFIALSNVLAVAVFMIILGSIGISFLFALVIVVPIMAIGMWAARHIALLVEKKRHTLSVGAAFFSCAIIAPWIILLINLTFGKWFVFQFPIIETLTAMAIAYAFGEGIGRLACISFGCCYGKPLADCNPMIQKILQLDKK